MRLIDADALYEKVQHDEELARNRVLDTESTMPYPNNLNPSYTRYVAQMDERTRLKYMIADAPTIEPERKTGKWVDAVLPNDNGGLPVQVCDQCNTFFPLAYTGGGHRFCPNCGEDMRGEQE